MILVFLIIVSSYQTVYHFTLAPTLPVWPTQLGGHAYSMWGPHTTSARWEGNWDENVAALNRPSTGGAAESPLSYAPGLSHCSHLPEAQLRDRPLGKDHEWYLELWGNVCCFRCSAMFGHDFNNHSFHTGFCSCGQVFCWINGEAKTVFYCCNRAVQTTVTHRNAWSSRVIWVLYFRLWILANFGRQTPNTASSSLISRFFAFLPFSGRYVSDTEMTKDLFLLESSTVQSAEKEPWTFPSVTPVSYHVEEQHPLPVKAENFLR